MATGPPGARPQYSEEAPPGGPTSQDQVSLLSFVAGIDEGPRPLSAEEVGRLKDPFAATVLLVAGRRPSSFKETVAAVESGRGEQGRIFVVGDGSQTPDPKTPPEGPSKLDRPLRFVFAANDVTDGTPSIMVVGDIQGTSSMSFLQAVAWDTTQRVFNYYARIGMDDKGVPVWAWHGDSTHAFDARSRRQGPFDGHVNGALVMKELRFPWTHWHSGAASIPDTVLPDNADKELFVRKSKAEDLEKIVVRPGILQWTDERLSRAFQGGVITGELGGPRALLRHLFESSTFNLVSSAKEITLAPKDGLLPLPRAFFLNVDVLEDLLGAVGGSFPSTSGKFRVKFDDYTAALAALDVHLVGSTADGRPVKIPGDTFFAFLVPEPAFEDNSVVLGMSERRIFSPKFLLCTQLVGFASPIYSAARHALMPGQKVVPVDMGGIAPSEVEQSVVDSILAAAADATGNAAAQEFRRWWSLDEQALAAAASETLQKFVDAVDAKCRGGGQAFVEDLLRLADQRRRWAKGLNNELNEFALTLPRIGEPKAVAAGGGCPAQRAILAMREDGSVGPEGPELEAAAQRLQAKVMRSAPTAPCAAGFGRIVAACAQCPA